MESCTIDKLKDGNFVYEGIVYENIDDLLSDLKDDLSGSEEDGESEMTAKKDKVKKIMSEDTENEGY